MSFHLGKTSCIFSVADVAKLLSRIVVPIYASTSKMEGELLCSISLLILAIDGSVSWARGEGAKGLAFCVCCVIF